MENSQDFIEILTKINQHLVPTPFWGSYEFWLDLGSIIVLIRTLYWLIRYTKATETMKVEMIRQTNLQQMPVVILYIRKIQDYMSDKISYEEIWKERKDFLIRIRTEGRNSDYFLVLKNIGNGAAFNIEVKSNLFEVKRYQNTFIAPKGDEQAFSIDLKTAKKIESWDTLRNSEFTIRCKDVSGAIHSYKYKILDVDKRAVKFIEKNMRQ